MDSTDESYSHTGCEPKDYYLMETYVESLTESLTHPQFPEQRFLEDVDYDDALVKMLHDAHRVHVCPKDWGDPLWRERGDLLSKVVRMHRLELFRTDKKSKSSPNVRRRLNTTSRLIMTEEENKN